MSCRVMSVATLLVCAAAALGPDDKMPMVGHDDIAENAQWHAGVGLGDDLLKGGEVGILFEQPQPTVGPIEHMVNVAADDRPGCSGHADNLAAAADRVNYRFASPLNFLELSG